MLTKPEFTENLQGAFTAMPGGSRCEDCPEPEVLWAALQGEQGGLSAEERRAIVRHTAECSACAEDWRVTREFLKEQEKAARNGKPCEVSNGHPSWFGENLYKVAAAALVVLAVGVGGWLFHEAPESNFRGQQTQEHQTQSSNLDGATLPREDFVLRWAPTPRAKYKLFVMNQLGDSLQTESGLEKPQFRVSPEVLQQLTSGDQVLWQVEVADPQEGNRLLGPFTTYLED